MKEDAAIYSPGDNGQARPEHETNFLSAIVTLLNDIYGLNLTDDDRVDIERIKITLESDDGLQVVFTGEAMRYKFEQTLDMLILEFVHKKLDLYKKLTEPDTNAMFKQKWFEELYRKYQCNQTAN